ncbi:MAG: protease complex subunit PrcB family protein [Mahellales bacterium]
MKEPVIVLKEMEIPPWLEDYVLPIVQRANIFSIKGQDGGKYIVIVMGQQPTGGYGIELIRVVEDGMYYTADLEFYTPDEDEGVTQQLTYPWLILKKQTEKPVRVRVFHDRDHLQPYLNQIIK